MAQDVWRETTEESPFAPGAAVIRKAHWLLRRQARREVVETIGSSLDPGERSAIALALELGGALLIMDEDKGRRIARENGLETRGTLWVLMQAKKAGALAAVRPVIEELQQVGFRMTPRLEAQVLSEVGEA